MRLKSSLIALAAATAMVLAACSSGASDSADTSASTNEAAESSAATESASTTDAEDSASAAESETTSDTPVAQGTAPLTIAKPDGAITTESNNPWVGDSSGLKLGYINAILEPLAIVNLVDTSAEVIPWLADTLNWSDDYTSLTVTARAGVTWNDGTPFTADDIAFTYQLLIDHPELDTAALGLTGVKEDGNAVTLTFESAMFVKQDKVLHRLIVPKHIWENVADPATEVNLDPVGTGPYVLSQFTTQSVELTARTDYWGGPLAVPTLYYVSYNDNTALTTALASGDADWAQAFIPNVQSSYLDKDPEHNVYWAAAGLGIDTMFVNTTTKPFNDVAFRKAVNMVIDRDKYAAIAREGGVPVLSSVTGLPTPAGDASISSEFQGKNYSVDVDGARKVLQDAGYTWNGDTLTDPSGEAVTFELKVPQGWNDYVTGISLIADWVRPLGVTATVQTPDADSWWADKGTGDFQAILHWTDTGATAYDLYSDIMDGKFLKPVGESADFNFGRFDNADATAALKSFSTATDDAARATALAQVEKIFVDEVPAMPVGTRPFISEYNTRNYVGWPGDADPYVPADPTQPTAVLILTRLTPAS